MKNVCSVTNRSAGRVVYKIPELNNLRREFFPHETKRNISVEELEKLSQMPGGKNILYNYLIVEDKEVAFYLINQEIPPEYWFTEERLPEWMKTCSLDAFKDALDFAPQGAKDLIKKYAVSMPLDDRSKCGAIKDQLGFDVEKAIENSKADEPEQGTNKPATRRVAVTEEAPKRRVQLSSDD